MRGQTRRRKRSEDNSEAVEISAVGLADSGFKGLGDIARMAHAPDFRARR